MIALEFSVGPSTAQWMIDGKFQTMPGHLDIETTKVTLSGVAPDKMIETAPSQEIGLELLKQAKAYESTLTKLGKPRRTK